MPEDNDLKITTVRPGLYSFNTMSLAPLQKKIWRCQSGHEIEIYGDWYALHVVTSKGTAKYMFCPECWGEWAQKQWPIACEEVR